MKKSIKGLILATIILSVSACSTMERKNATTGETEVNSATWGALIGCASGAVTGALINKGKGAAIGCAGAGLIGGGAGYYMDQQEAKLRKELVGTGVQVVRYGESIVLVLDSDISFATGSSVVHSSIKPSLKSIVSIMNEYDDTTLVVSGHTDSVGSEMSNQLLSVSRAKTVQAILNGYGLSRSRTISEGYGELSPICDNKTKEGRACNRRVELSITPK